MTPFQTMVAYLSLGASPLAAVMIVMADIEGWAMQIIGLFILSGLAGTTYRHIRDDERAGGTSSRGGVESRHAAMSFGDYDEERRKPIMGDQRRGMVHPCSPEGPESGDSPQPSAGVAPGPREAKRKRGKK